MKNYLGDWAERGPSDGRRKDFAPFGLSFTGNGTEGNATEAMVIALQFIAGLRF